MIFEKTEYQCGDMKNAFETIREHVPIQFKRLLFFFLVELLLSL